MAIEVYVVPAITDNRILPTSAISSGYLSNQIFLSGCPGQYVPASFVVRAVDEDILSLLPVPSTLTGPGVIPIDNVDIRWVKCWLQAPQSYPARYSGIKIAGAKTKVLTPELLLKDDSLVKVEDNENYVKLETGVYEWVSEFQDLTEDVYKKVEEFPVKDSSTLQATDIPAGTNKQVWITLKVPNNIQPGTYSGIIDLTIPGGSVGQVNLQLEVCNIELLESMLTYSIYYSGRWYYRGGPNGTIGNLRTPAQIKVELANMRDHGVLYPGSYQSWESGSERLGTVLSLFNELGMPVNPFYWHQIFATNTPQDYEALRSRLQQAKDFFAAYGVEDLYTYLPDEQEVGEETRRQVAIAHEVGTKCFVALGKDKARRAVDVLDLACAAYDPDATLAALYHSHGHKIFSYANPQVGCEIPETYRRNFGLLLWQRDYDGAMDYNYMRQMGFVWNDFDHVGYKDYVFAYPTMNGVVDTLEWEGFREGVTDVRYLTTLLNAIETAKGQGIDTSEAESYLSGLKAANLSALNLDVVRWDMIEHILYLQGEPVTPPPPPPAPTGLFIIPILVGLLGLVVTTAVITTKPEGGE